MTALTHLEDARLTDAERVIERGLGTFVEVGKALGAIRDQRLYRVTHETFEAYCSERWGFSDRRARQMIDAAATTEALPTGTTVPVNEGQARALAGLAPEVAAEVMTTAHEYSGGQPTAEAIRQARAHVTTTTRTTEATKVEHNIDLNTGEITDDYADLDTDEETFEAALSAARSEGDLSRENVVGHIAALGASAAIADFVASSQAVQDANYIHGFIKAFARADDFLGFDADRLAVLMDDAEVASLQRHVTAVAHFCESICRARRGLRLVKG